MKILFGDLKREYAEMKSQIDNAVQKVLDSGWFILGKEGEAFENEFAGYCGSKYCIGCASGTEAIALSLMAYGIKNGDEVVTTNITAVPTISAISMTGATPVLVDVEADACLMDASQIEPKISPRTKAIVPVHLYGQICDMDKILEIAQRHNLRVIEDACQAHGSEYKGKKAGAMGDTGCFSFYPSKNLGCYGDGGAITTNDEETYNRLLMLRNYGQSKRYYHDIIGINSRLDELQASILRVKLNYLDKWNERRNVIASIYDNEISNPIVTKPTVRKYNRSNFHLYVIQVDHRDQVKEQLEQNGVGTLIHYPVNIHLQRVYQYLGYQENNFEVSRNCAGRILSLPMYPQLTDEEVKYICHTINNI